MTPKVDHKTTAPVAVVTGGTRGIGRQTVEWLAEHGYSVALCGRSATDAKTVAREIADAFGSLTLGVGVDVADAAQVSDFAEAVASVFGIPTVVVCNAAILGPVGALTVCDPVEWSYTLQVNVCGIANVVGLFARRMETIGRGKFVVLSGGGVGGPRVSPRLSAYTTSKAAVVMLVETLAEEFKEAGLQINAVAPGAMPTGFTAGILLAGPTIAGVDLFEATARNSALEGSFHLYAELFEFLVSSESDWLTGRLLSARWETPELLRQQRSNIEASDRFRLRRIDESLYAEMSDQ